MPKPESVVGVLGATSLVGNRLFAPEFKPLSDKNLTWVAFSRNKQAFTSEEIDNVHWCVLHDDPLPSIAQKIEYWICLAPIWVLSDYFSLLESLGARRIVALSSTSRFSKINSIDVSEQNLANRLVDSEQQLINWAEKNKIAWIIVRPTLIYGFGRDQNITTIARFIQRFGFFPLLGKANGLRQPIHVDDVARICLLVLFEEKIINKAYNVSGGEILSYKNMVERVFNALEVKPRYFHLPLIVFRILIAILHFFPQFRKISVGMADRMNQDLIFPSQDAKHDLKFEPKGFQLSKDDVGK